MNSRPINVQAVLPSETFLEKKPSNSKKKEYIPLLLILTLIIPCHFLGVIAITKLAVFVTYMATSKKIGSVTKSISIILGDKTIRTPFSRKWYKKMPYKDEQKRNQSSFLPNFCFCFLTSLSSHFLCQSNEIIKSPCSSCSGNAMIFQTNEQSQGLCDCQLTIS